jgi:hypothetical protein
VVGTAEGRLRIEQCSAASSVSGCSLIASGKETSMAFDLTEAKNMMDEVNVAVIKQIDFSLFRGEGRLNGGRPRYWTLEFRYQEIWD